VLRNKEQQDASTENRKPPCYRHSEDESVHGDIDLEQEALFLEDVDAGQ
jgi:hypothetical protein